MSARIAPEPVSIAIAPHVDYQPRTERSTRPIEPSEAANADKRQNPGTGNQQRNAIERPRAPDRPPGTDPSVPPQSLLDASLIASEFKASAVLVEVSERSEAAEQNVSIVPDEENETTPVSTEVSIKLEAKKDEPSDYEKQAERIDSARDEDE